GRHHRKHSALRLPGRNDCGKGLRPNHAGRRSAAAAGSRTDGGRTMKPLSESSREKLVKLMATPVRRKYFESLQRMLGPAGLVSIREEQFFLVLAIAIGILAGLCVVLFRVAIQAARLWLLGSSMHPAMPRVVLVPAAMGLLIGVLAVRFFPRVRGSGVVHTKGALYIYDGHISPMT